MKTAAEVLERIDAELRELQAKAAGPCIDALVEWTDRDAYREAMRRAYGLKAVQTLRDKLAGEIEQADLAEQAGPKSARKAGRSGRGGNGN